MLQQTHRAARRAVRRRRSRRPSCEHSECSGGQSAVGSHAAELEACERREGRRLEDDGAAGGERRGNLNHRLHQRIVPRRDAADDARWCGHDAGGEGSVRQSDGLLRA